MQDIIHLLPDSVANQIAAGEVVQRPASIVKELVENSIDAGAAAIQVMITDGGRTCVQVIDDGKGMSETDARLAFERHATSKITTANDLFTLTTMGFRGEALASIAAVAQVELRTRRPEDELGTFIRLAGSKVEAQEPVACPAGSNFAVRNLFFNVPARRKFLKSNQTELSNIVTDFERIVLTHPDISFTLSNNNTEIYNLQSARLRQRILDVIGKKRDSELVQVSVETSLATIDGYVCQPCASKKRGAQQFFFVNGRYMNHPYFRSAVVHAYENLIPAGEQPSFFLYLTVDPASIDVNVHPTKTEIKFDYEQDIWQILHASVKEALGKMANTPSIDFDVEDRPEIPAMGYNTGTQVQQPKLAPPKYNPFDFGGNAHRPAAIPDWETLYDNTIQAPQTSQTTLWSDDAIGHDSTDNNDNPAATAYSLDQDYRYFQYKGRYVVLPEHDGILLIDQHRAHINVLYEQYINTMFQKQSASQGMLFPELIQFTASEQILLEELLPDLELVGFELTNLGGGSYSICGVPSSIESVNPVKLLHDLISAAGEINLDIKEDVHKSIALTMAKTMAIPYGQVLSDDEVRLLISQLFSMKTPRFTPDGYTVISVIEDSAIDVSFKK